MPQSNTNQSPPVPAVDSAANLTMRHVIGNKSDTHDGNSLASFAHTTDEHQHSVGEVIPSGQAGVTLTAGDANPWTLGGFEVVAATNAITDEFDIHFVVVEAMSANATYEIVLYSGADASEVEIARFRIVRVTNQVKSAMIPIQTLIITANTQIKAKVMSSTGNLDTTTISLQYHTY